MSKRQEVVISSTEASRQASIIYALKERLKNQNLKYCISTFGCQMNARDSEKIEGMLEQIGYAKTEKEEEADFILYNTCCVRENAEHKIYGRLGHLKTLKKKRPHLMIALCGCMMQQDIVLETLKKSYRFVDIIFGTYNIYKLPELMEARLDTGEAIIDIWESHKDIVEDLPSSRKYPFKACVNIMYGCNNFCTYCIVPYVRGRERSRQKSDILNEIQMLAKEGVKEIMLLGQNVNSYGKGLEENCTFAALLEAVAQIEGIERIRFMTSHPKDLSDDLIQVITRNKKICKGIHLPFQAGSSDILKKMNRHYTKEGYLALVQKMKSAIPELVLTTDIIVGFPGETEEDFLQTMEVVKEVEFISAYTFIYSKRTGTPAATMTDQIDETVVKERFNRLLEVVDQASLNVITRFRGKEVEVLFEEQSKNNPHLLTGRTDEGILVHVEADSTLIGQIASVKITDNKTHYLMGELV
jgi:tRNA-2-methylthio-N6-dimethylallyladenosine synthase